MGWPNHGPIMKKSIQRRYSITDIAGDAVKSILRSYFSDLYDLVARERAEVITDDLIKANNLPPR
jgi:hypothetical protein